MMRIFRELKQSDNINETTETANATSAATTEKQMGQKIPRKQRPVPTIKERKQQQTDEKGKSVPKLYI